MMKNTESRALIGERGAGEEAIGKVPCEFLSVEGSRAGRKININAEHLGMSENRIKLSFSKLKTASCGIQFKEGSTENVDLRRLRFDCSFRGASAFFKGQKLIAIKTDA